MNPDTGSQSDLFYNSPPPPPTPLASIPRERLHDISGVHASNGEEGGGGVGHACESNDDQEMLVFIPTPFLFSFQFLRDLGKDFGCDFINVFAKRINRCSF